MNHHKKIYTLTFNPSLDLYLKIKDLRFGITNRTFAECYRLGGKGFNVSRVLYNLGFVSCAVGFVGGFIGEEIAKQVAKLPFKHHLFHKREGISRINIKFSDTEINLTGLLIDDNDFIRLLTFFDSITPDDIVIISGNIQTKKTGLLKSLLAFLKNKNVRFILDTYPEDLLDLLDYHPFLIKPNTEEMEYIFKRSINSIEELTALAQKLSEKGAQNIIVSLGSKGSLAVFDDRLYRSCTIAETCVNPIGAGDSMVAGFTAGYLASADYQKAYRLAIACANACVMNEGLPDFKAIKACYHQVRIDQQ